MAADRGARPGPGDGEVLVKVTYLSLDPAMRGWMNDVRSYIPPVGIGEVMRAGGVGRVVELERARFAVGDYVVGLPGVQEYARPRRRRACSRIDRDARAAAGAGSARSA